MMRSSGPIMFVCCLFILTEVSVGEAAECAFGSVHASFRSAQGVWENATAHPMLKRGELFEIKIKIQVKTHVRVVYIKLHEFGTPVYEVIRGPSKMEQLLEHWGPILDNQSIEYLWKMRVRVNTSWVNGNSPLEVFVQFTKDDSDDASIMFDIINAFIRDTLWENYSSGIIDDTSTEQEKNLPRLSYPSIGGILFILVLSGSYLRKKQHR